MQKISAGTIDSVMELTDMKALVENYTHLEMRGGKWWGCCPFHGEKTPSFNIDTERKMYYCFGCGKGGNLLTFVKEMEHLSFTEAIEFLAKKQGIEIVFENSFDTPKDNTKYEILSLYERVANAFNHILTKTENGKNALSYLQERGISSEIIEKFKLGFAPSDRKWLYSFLKKKSYSEEFLSKTGLFSKKYFNISFFSNRIMFPIHNRHGNVIAFGGRILSGEGPKYLNSSDMPQYKKSENLFAFNLALPEIRKKKSVIICEGYMDVLAFHQAGITNSVAPLGTALTEDQVKILKGFANTFYLSFDSDEAGQNATYKAVTLSRKQGLNLRILSIENGKDPAEILQKNGNEGLILLLKNAILDDDYLMKLAGERFDINSTDGKAGAVSFFFPYLESLDSDIRKESTISKLADVFGITQKSIISDYGNAGKNIKDYKVKSSEAVKQIKTPVRIKRTAELRLVLAAAANPDMFKKMRSEISIEDFDDSSARELFIVLEECYRIGGNTFDNLLTRCTNASLRELVSEAIMNGEFSENPFKILEDGIKLLKQNKLQKQRSNIIGRLQLLSGKNSVEDRSLMNDLIAEKKEIDGLIAELKGKTL